MTQAEFLNGWMRIGTSAKQDKPTSRRFKRIISGEKGIGRFAVRYLGRRLEIETVAFDRKRNTNTVLTAAFNWPEFDRTEDLGSVTVPYELRRASPELPLGTKLTITDLRQTNAIDFESVETASLGLLSPYRTLLRAQDSEAVDLPSVPEEPDTDPGFNLKIQAGGSDDEETVDVAKEILKHYVLRCVASIEGDRLKLRLYERGNKKAFLRINDKYENEVGRLYADIRFYPRRAGTFADADVDGRRAQSWIKKNGGVAVFDRNFRVSPYGTEGDDWLKLSADRVSSARNTRSTLAAHHFPMDDEQQKSTALNYMLRLPYQNQVIGAVQAYGVRSQDEKKTKGLIPAADREGFLNNTAFRQLFDIVRGAVEAIAYVDREIQIREEKEEAKERLAAMRRESRRTADEIRNNKDLSARDKASLLGRLAAADEHAAKREELRERRDSALEIMSLLGVVSGFMTHEFGTAIDVLERAKALVAKLAKKDSALDPEVKAIELHIQTLKDFVAYSQGYVKGAPAAPDKAYPARPRVQQVIRVFGKYASDRGIDVLVDIEPSVNAPQVPVSLYSGIVLNLYTNALKAVIAKSGKGSRKIAFRAWNEKGMHRLEVSDTGVGIPSTLHKRIFDPLFTTTDTNRDPLGSGMGLGLTLVRRGAESFGGKVHVVEPPPGFTTCMSVRLPLDQD